MSHLALALLLTTLVNASTSSTRPAPSAVEATGAAYTAVSFDPGEPATKATAKLLALVDEIDRTRTDTLYTHSTRINRKQGIYHFDCSGMMNWMLARVAKRSLETLDRERPVASTYVKIIERAPTTRARNGWQRIADLAEVQPGDLFAWRRPDDWPNEGATGHVGIVVARPARLPHIHNGWAVRVLDSTRWQHEDDTRSDDETGWGRGTLLFVSDDEGRPIGYGWHGGRSGGYYETSVVFGRVH